MIKRRVEALAREQQRETAEVVEGGRCGQWNFLSATRYTRGMGCAGGMARSVCDSLTGPVWKGRVSFGFLTLPFQLARRLAKDRQHRGIFIASQLFLHGDNLIEFEHHDPDCFGDQHRSRTGKQVKVSQTAADGRQ